MLAIPINAFSSYPGATKIWRATSPNSKADEFDREEAKLQSDSDFSIPER